MKHLLTVIAIVLAFACCTTEADRNRMSALLDRADSMNRAYIPMTDGIDSLLLEATHFYDRHGTANEQMRAHYLLGCAYRDKGEAPAALQSYQDAVDRADTLSSDCDYRRLMSVYGQMAEIFHAQNLPEDEIEICDKYGQLALKMQDTLLYIRNMELMVKPYYIMGDTASVLRVIEQVKQLYEKYGCHQEAVASNGVAISIALNRGQYTYACELMREIETESDLFQKDGEIAKGREIYYDFKGRYFIGIDQLDSAEYYMRKLSNYPQYTKSVCRSMLSIYQLKRNTDSIVKYSRLYEDAVDTRNNAMRTDIVHQMSSLYNYQRYQRKADAEALALSETKSQRNGYAIVVLVVIILLVMSLRLYINSKIKRRETLYKLKENWILLKKLRLELSMLQQHEKENEVLIAEKENEIKELEERVGTRPSVEALLHDSEVYKRFQGFIATGHTPEKEDWEQLSIVIKDILPAFDNFLKIHDHEFVLHESQICMLIRIHIPPQAIAHMLGVSASFVSKRRIAMAEKFFGEKGKPSCFDEHITKYL